MLYLLFSLTRIILLKYLIYITYTANDLSYRKRITFQSLSKRPHRKDKDKRLNSLMIL